MGQRGLSARAALAGAAASIPEGQQTSLTDQQRELARELASYYAIFKKSSHLWRDGRPLHEVTKELLDAIAAAPGAAAPLASTAQAATPAQAEEEAGMAQAQDEFTSEWLFKNCRIVFFPPDGQYPVEHNPRALGYDKDGSNFKNNIRAALRAATKEKP